MHLKSSFEYRLNTLLLSISSVVTILAELLSIVLLFQGFKSVGEWGFYETELMFGIIISVFSFTECFARGFDEFPSLIKSGQLDRLLVRPVNIFYQILGSKIEFSKLARFFSGIVIVIISLIHLSIEWTFVKVIVLIMTFICGAIVIFGLMLIIAGISVFTVENLEFTNILTNGAKEIAYYPINIYGKWLKNIFTFIIPVACFNYLPVSYLLGMKSQIIYALSPLIGLLFIIPCILFFNFALKKYQGTGT